jgi:hypothetical protein
MEHRPLDLEVAYSAQLEEQKKVLSGIQVRVDARRSIVLVHGAGRDEISGNVHILETVVDRVVSASSVRTRDREQTGVGWTAFGQVSLDRLLVLGKVSTPVKPRRCDAALCVCVCAIQPIRQ